MRSIVLLVAVAACGRVGFEAQHDGGSGSDAAIMSDRCIVPPLPDVSNPTTVIQTCDEATLRAALATGGVITFACGPATIPVVGAIQVSTDTVLFAGGRDITLDAQTSDRVFHVTSAGPTLTLVGLTIENAVTLGSGAAILVDAGSLVVFDGTFTNNTGASFGANIGGGAIAAQPNTATVAVYNTNFSFNTAASGGAIQAYAGLTVVGGTMNMNSALGTGGPSSNGGVGGAINATGTGDTTICGTKLTSNSAGDAGGAMFRVAIGGMGATRLTDVLIDNNAATASGGGAYIQDNSLALDGVAVSNNVGNLVGGLWFLSANGTFMGTNVSIVNNRGDSGLGAGLRLDGTPGTLSFSTISSNRGNCGGCFSAGIHGAGSLHLASSIVSDQAAGTAPVSCATPAIDDGHNYQWPSDSSPCAAAATVADPLLQPVLPLMGPHGSYVGRAPVAQSPVVGVATGCPATDMIGRPRPTPCAAGALEP